MLTEKQHNLLLFIDKYIKETGFSPSFEEMKEGVEFAHARGKKVFLTLNIIPHNEDLLELESYLKILKEVQIDAVILADPGTLLIVKEQMPGMEIHLSTQANNTNYMGAKFWQSQGVKRIVLARELSLVEIKEIVDQTKSIDSIYER